MENKRIIAIRVDSSIEIGSGHVMRCLTLAEQLSSPDIKIFFICSELAGNMIDFIQKEGYLVFTFYLKETNKLDCWRLDLEYTKKILSSFKKKVDWLIVDHYSLDVKWETSLRDYAKKIIVVDDLANRQHDCDVLIDQNFYMNMKRRYINLVPKSCEKLLGPQYALLRSEFYEARNNLRQRDGVVKRIFVFFGGSDPTNETSKALEAIKILNRPDIAVDIVVGVANQYKEQIKEYCANMPNLYFHCQVDNMAELMANSDLAIGAGGVATWERCFLGLPTLAIIVADNQIKAIEAVVKVGAIQNLGMSINVLAEDLAAAITINLEDPERLKTMTQKAICLMGKEANFNYMRLKLNIDDKNAD